MYTITGVTGHVGSAAARELLDRGAPVRAVVRDAAKGSTWAQQGAEVAIADFDDPAALARALRGSAGAFLLLPTIPTLDDAGHRGMADSLATAVGDSGVPHVVLLSSIGADLPEGTGPIRWLHHLENRLRRTDAVVSAIRPTHFQEKVEDVLGAALADGIYPVFADTADVATPMVATRDVGRQVAEALLTPPASGEVIDLHGPEYTEREVAGRLAEVLGRPLQVVTIPRSGWLDALIDAGLPAPFAREIIGLHDAADRGLLVPHGDRSATGTTPIEETLREVVAVATSRAVAP